MTCSDEIADALEVVEFVGTIEEIGSEKKFLRMAYPNCLIRRYGDIPEAIYIRKCYEELYEVAVQILLDKSFKYPVTSFIGVPGIGKSLFLIYYLHRLVNDDRIPNERFACQLEAKEYITFDHIGDHRYEIRKVLDVSEVFDRIVLQDVHDPIESCGITKSLFIFGSPSAQIDSKYVSSYKANFRYIMPTWSEEGLECVDPTRHWYDYYLIFGGVPRYLFWRKGKDASIQVYGPNHYLTEMLIEKGNDMMEHFTRSGFKGLAETTNYMFVHFNPGRNLNGSWQNGGRKIFSFASDEMLKYLVSRHQNALKEMAVNIYDAGIGAAVYGAICGDILFEKFCIFLRSIAGKFVTVCSGCLNLPREYLALSKDWKFSKVLQGDTLYYSRDAITESREVFCVISSCSQFDSVRKWTLIVFKFVVGSSHPINGNSLLTIIESFPECIRSNIVSKWFVFVSPGQPSCFIYEQPISTGKMKLPEEIAGFRLGSMFYSFVKY